MSRFRILNDYEVSEFKKWARENYVIGTAIKYDLHHPACTRECEVMNREHFRVNTVNAIMEAIVKMDVVEARSVLEGMLSKRVALRDLVNIANDMEVTLEPQPCDQNGNSIV